MVDIRLTYLKRERFDRLHFGAMILREKTAKTGLRTRSLEHDERDGGDITRIYSDQKREKHSTPKSQTFGVSASQ